MTIRRRTSSRLSLEQIASALPPEVMEMYPPADYRAYSQALTEEVERITGVYDLRLAMAVAEVLGVSVVDWFRLQLLGR